MKRPVSAVDVQRSVVGPTTKWTRAGTPSTTNNEETVRPVVAAPAPAVTMVTPAGRRPRNRRALSRSAGSGWNGFSEWIIVPTLDPRFVTPRWEHDGRALNEASQK